MRASASRTRGFATVVSITLAAACEAAALEQLATSTASMPHQGLRSAQSIDVARRYAPIFWLATDEPVYPMLPRPFAFDGIDNDSDGCFDLEDIDEVRMDSGDVAALQRALARLGPSSFTYPLEKRSAHATGGEKASPGSAVQQYDLEAKQGPSAPAIYEDDIDTDGPVSSVVRSAFANRGIVLSGYSIVESGIGGFEVTSYEPVGTLEGRVLELLPTCPRPPCDLEGISAALRDRLEHAGFRGVTKIALSEGGWFLYDTSGAADSTWSFRVQPSGSELAVFGRGKQVFEATSDESSGIVRVVHPSRLPPPRILYHHSGPGKRIEGREFTQYWSYYLFDLGGGAHRHDGEHVFTFRDEIGTVRCVVGAGHTDASANNILIATPELRQDVVLPVRLPNHMPFLVELGKHASAPDRGLDGRFDIGMDANVHYRDTWGTRDLAAAVGVTTIRPAQPKFTFPRDTSTLLVARDWSRERLRHRARSQDPTRSERGGGESERSGHGNGSQLNDGLVHDDMTTLDVVYMNSIETTESKFRDVDVARKSRHEHGNAGSRYVDSDGLLTYELFPIEDYAYLVDGLLANACAGTTTVDCTKKSDVEQWLEEHKSCFWGSTPPKSVSIADDVFEEMRRWPSDRDAKRDVWRHNNFRNPNDIFKPWLFPRVALFGAVVNEGPDWRLRTGVRFSTGFTPYSELEIGVGFAMRDQAFRDILGTYYFFRGGHQGWYAALGYTDDPELDSVTVVSLGFVPVAWDTSALPVVRLLGHNRLRLHTGLRAEMDGFPSRISALEIQVGFSIARGVSASRHPLRQ